MTSLPGGLRCEDLIAFDVVPSLLSAAQSAGLSGLLPLQEQAIRAGLLSLPDGSRPEQDLLFIAEPGSGKRTIAELAAAHHAHAGHRVLLVTHDLESARRCVQRFAAYAAIGLRTGLLQDPADFAALDLAVAPLDTAALLLASDEPVRRGLGLVLVEELEQVADSADSELWPLLLLRCQALRADLPLRMLLLCGDVRLGEKLALLLRAKVVRAGRQLPSEEDAPSLKRARALLQLRGGIAARRDNTCTAVHVARPR